ncbi:mismatch repair endonuclease PMS2-like [Tubulanus polymorphus]|uniref:mismatch repair endonuclease PMS2-like n=1 Tax=Tubulanus polymorphus TaxID=672921 RepID=UPI003DA2CF65
MVSIQAIDKTSVHRICSGQVILNLATAVKELVENSIDAGSNNIDVRLKEYGSESIEIVDNGSGVEEKNFQALTLKHHTSKLKDFSDLVSVDTFGFRGEALSSLCALSQVSVVTCHKSATNGTKLEFNHAGCIVRQIPCARQHGTSVTVQNIFSTLPVRHKEFQRNIKKEFIKMTQVLTAYCLISNNIRIHCTNINGKKKTSIVCTNGNKTVKENVTNVFGPKQIASLIEFVQCLPDDEICQDMGVSSVTDESGGNSVFKIEGYVSSCEHGKGRSSADRQFFYVNKRPCDLLKVSRLLNEVYHIYNRHQYPFVLLDISLDKESVDVNVTPDKRQIFIEHEKLLLAIIKASLIQMFEPLTSVYEVKKIELPSRSNLDSKKLDYKNDAKNTNERAENSENIFNKLKRTFAKAFSKQEDMNKNGNTSKQPKLEVFFENKTSKTSSSSVYSTNSPAAQVRVVKDESNSDVGLSSSFIQYEDASVLSGSNYCSEMSELKNLVEEDGTVNHHTEISGNLLVEDGSQKLSGSTNFNENSGNVQSSLDCPGDYTNCCSQLSTKCDSELIEAPALVTHTPTVNSPRKTESNIQVDLAISSDLVPVDFCGGVEKERGEIIDEDSSVSDFRGDEMSDFVSGDSTRYISEVKVIKAALDGSGDGNNECNTDTLIQYDEGNRSRRKVKTIPFSWSKMKEKINSARKQKERNLEESKSPEVTRLFRAKINPSDNKNAEEELAKQVSKDMFSKMEVLGQFNLGFIIAKHGDDLFIVDQHATDEKYNFETLQKESSVQGQRLIQPLPLELTAINESIVIDNLDIFRKNGFEFQINEAAPSTEKVRLVSAPVLKNYHFGKEDVDEMIFMLSYSPGAMCRPSRVRQIFASKACRKSIMIGTALTKPEMKKLLNHMSEIEQPWNCPHGRPTMRHLINLRMLPT